MKALIIDDERLARNELRRLLAAHTDIEIVGEAVDVEDAMEKVEGLKPELLFGDRASLTLLSEPAGCVTADVLIPLKPPSK